MYCHKSHGPRPGTITRRFQATSRAIGCIDRKVEQAIVGSMETKVVLHTQL